MGYERRQALIKELQNLRDSKIVTHINSDRRSAEGAPVLPGLVTMLATEAQPFFYDALRDLGQHERIELFLYTSGGQTDSVWPLVSLFREFTTEFNVLVPYKAHSGGTLICLGANKIIFGTAGEISPVDPATGHDFNPVDDINPRQRRRISVEEVTAYFDLASNPSKYESAEDVSHIPPVDVNLAFRLLAEQVHPIALGNINRSYKQIRELANRLLETHNSLPDSKGKQEAINSLTQARFSHTDILNRKEAADLLGNNMVEFADADQQRLMWEILQEYQQATSMRSTFVLQNEIGDAPNTDIPIIGAFIESESCSYVFRCVSTVWQRSIFPQNMQITLQPGQPFPIMPGLPREYNIMLKDIGWVENKEKI